MITFKDLKFEPRDFGGVGATHTFDNGITISVQASKLNYSTPREDLTSSDQFSSFEVAIWNEDGDFVTKDLFQADDDVVGWCERDDIDDIIAMVANQ